MNFYYISFDIRSNSMYPIGMYGLTNEVNFKDISKKDINSFVNDFYKTSFYTSELQLRRYNSFLEDFMGKENAKKYLQDDPDYGYKMSKKILDNSIEIKFKLLSGENVFINITKIKGDFWFFNSSDVKNFTNSGELELEDIANIKKCYIPFKIEYYKKPKESEIN